MQFFAHLLGETDPIFNDPMAARAQGYPDIVAPPSFPAVIETLANDEQRRRGVLPLTEDIGCDFHHLLHGEQHFTYEGLRSEESRVGTECVSTCISGGSLDN